MQHVVHLDDIDFEKVAVLCPEHEIADDGSLIDISKRPDETPPPVISAKQLVACYPYPSVNGGKARVWDVLQLQVDDGAWFGPSYFASNKWERMTTCDGAIAIDMGINPMAKMKQVHEKLECTLTKPSDRLIRLCDTVRERIEDAYARYELPLPVGGFTMPNKEKNGFMNFKAKIRIVLVDSRAGDGNRHDIIPRAKMMDYIQKQRAIWVTKDLTVVNPEGEKLSPYEDVFVALADGFSGSAVLRFCELAPYNAGKDVSCSLIFKTIEADTFGKVTPTHTEPVYTPCAKRPKWETSTTTTTTTTGDGYLPPMPSEYM